MRLRTWTQAAPLNSFPASWLSRRQHQPQGWGEVSLRGGRRPPEGALGPLITLPGCPSRPPRRRSAARALRTRQAVPQPMSARRGREKSPWAEWAGPLTGWESLVPPRSPHYCSRQGDWGGNWPLRPLHNPLATHRGMVSGQSRIMIQEPHPGPESSRPAHPHPPHFPTSRPHVL